MTIEEYLQWTHTTRCYPLASDADGDCLYLGLLGELGEVAQEIRDGAELDRQKLLLEFGDVLWYFVRLVGAGSVWERAQAVLAEEESDPSMSDATLLEVVSMRTGYTEPVWIVVALLVLLRRYGYTLAEVMAANVAKIEARRAAGTVHGAGDAR